jgi:predicted nucleic acid-binding protein
VRTAVDSSALLLVLRRQPGWEAWREVLTKAAAEGLLLISPVVFAECASGYPSPAVACERFEAIQLHYDPFTPEAAYLAGRTFLQYRSEGGPRETLIPDFLIAAHAAVQADRLAATDRGYLRRYFPRIPLVNPG